MSLTKSHFVKKLICDECGWFEKLGEGFLINYKCCPDCGNEKIHTTVGRYLIETTTCGIWPFRYQKNKSITFEKKER